MKCFFSLLILLVYLIPDVKAQTTQFKYRVWIKNTFRVYESVPEPGSEEIVRHAGEVVKSQRTYNIEDTAYTLNSKIRLTKNDIVYGDKSHSKLRQLGGWANLSIDKDDPSKLNINYWSNADNDFYFGQHILIMGKKWTDSILLEDVKLKVNYVSIKDYTDYNSKMKQIDTLNKKIAVNLANVHASQNAQAISYIKILKDSITDIRETIVKDLWLGYDQEIYFLIRSNAPTLKEYANTLKASLSPKDTLNFVLKSSDMLDYALAYANGVYARKYSANPYYMKFENRQFQAFRFKCWEAGALTIPFRFRPTVSRAGKDTVRTQFLADLNAGAYVGISMGKVKYRYTRDEDNSPYKTLFSTGIFLNLSRLELDADNTHLSDKPLKSKQQVLALSPGIALMTSIFNFRAGVFVGADFAFGNAAKQWDYNHKLWIGIGFGYNIAMFWAASN